MTLLRTRIMTRVMPPASPFVGRRQSSSSDTHPVRTTARVPDQRTGGQVPLHSDAGRQLKIDDQRQQPVPAMPVDTRRLRHFGRPFEQVRHLDTDIRRRWAQAPAVERAKLREFVEQV